MPKFSVSLLEPDIACLKLSSLIFPFSLELALFCFTCFLVGRIWLTAVTPQLKLIKFMVAIGISVAMVKFFAESRSPFYPVSYYDYFFLVATVCIIRIKPLTKAAIQQLTWAMRSSLPIIFICYLPTLDFQIRNHWGFGNPNWLGLYSSLCLPLVLCRLIDCRKLDRKTLAIKKSNISYLLNWASLLIAFVMMISSGSRSSLYTSLVIIVVILIKLSCKDNIYSRKNLKLIFYPIIFLLVSGSIYKLLPLKFTFLHRFFELTNSTNIYRAKLYQCHVDLALQKPWLGWGMNHVSAICEQKLGATYGGVNHAHNFILQLFADHGLVITLVCLILLVGYLVMPGIVFLSSYDLRNSALPLGIYLSAISMLIVSLFQSGLYHYPLFPIWLGLLWGCQLSWMQKVN